MGGLPHLSWLPYRPEVPPPPGRKQAINKNFRPVLKINITKFLSNNAKNMSYPKACSVLKGLCHGSPVHFVYI